MINKGDYLNGTRYVPAEMAVAIAPIDGETQISGLFVTATMSAMQKIAALTALPVINDS